MTQKLFIQTNGCQMNEYDSDKMRDVLHASHGFELIDDPKLADVLLLNTSSIREKAQEKVFSTVGRWKKIKDKRPDVIIGVGGCVASQEGADIVARAPYVDLVFGPQTYHRLPQLLRAAGRTDEDEDLQARIVDPLDRVAEVREVALDRVEDDRPDHVPDVRRLVDGRSAQVDADLARADRFERLFLPREGVVDTKTHVGGIVRAGEGFVDAGRPPASDRAARRCRS